MTNYVAPGPVASNFIASRGRRAAIIGPFGSGKSGASIMKILTNVFTLQQPANERAPKPGLRYSRWAVVRNTWPMLRDTTLKTWFQWVPDGSIGTYKATEKTFHIRAGDAQAEIMFRALDDANDIRNLLGGEYTGVWLNEGREFDKEIVDTIDGRIRFPPKEWGGITCPQLFMDTNPPEEYSYSWEIFEGIDHETKQPWQPNDPRNPRWEVFKQPSGMSPQAENRDNLPANYYEDLARGKTRNFVNMYVHGEYGSAENTQRVHPAFSSRLHVSERRLAVDPHATVILGADFGLTPAIVIKQVDAFGRVRCLDEVVTQGMGLKRAIQTKLKPLLINRGYTNCRIFVTGDPAGTRRADSDERSCVDIFREEGFDDIEFALTNSPAARREATDHFLTQLGDDGAPLYQVDRIGCPVLTQGLLRGYHYPIRPGGVVATSVVKNIYSHICEANQYADMAIKDGRVGAGARLAQKRSFEVVDGPRYHYT